MTAKLDGTNGLLQQYDYQVLTTSFSYTFAAGTTVLVINPAGTLATGTITFPAAPVDGMTVTFSSTQQITALTLSGNGKTIVSAVTLLPANQATTYVYRLSNTSWYPMTNVATAITRAALPSGTVLQVQMTESGALATSSAIIPLDDTIPQITEGTEYMTVTITPTSASSTLYIQVTMMISNSGPNYRTIALFQDSTANALASVGTAASANWPVVQTFTHKMTAGTTSATTFRVRYGTDTSSTNTVSGVNGNRFFGNTIANSVMVTEVAP
jgi:hypothetical protein